MRQPVTATNNRLTEQDFDDLHSLIGLPWAPGGRGPREYDCYGLLLHVQKRYFGRSLEDVRVDVDSALECVRAVRRLVLDPSEATPLSKPENGAVCVMYTRGLPLHVGTYFDVQGGRILHSQEGAGVIFTASRQAGWMRQEFFRPL